MKTKAFGITDIGMKRKLNEDTFLVDEELGLFVVADGMGGHLGGEVASKLAAETMQKFCRDNKDLPPRDRLEKAVNKACEEIYTESKKDAGVAGMGTTVVALLVDGGYVYIAQVGDSRVYLFAQGAAWQVTEDHTIVQEEIRAGLISHEDAIHHQHKNVITRSVGYEKTAVVDIYRRKLQVNDTFLLCSDGLSGLVEIKEMLEQVAAHSMETGAEKLIELANSRGGDDNITIVLYRAME